MTKKVAGPCYVATAKIGKIDCLDEIHSFCGYFYVALEAP